MELAILTLDVASHVARLTAVFILLSSPSCLRQSPYHCASDTDCVLGGQGTCEPTGFCSFPDPTCSDGSRYNEFSGPYSNQCVGMVSLDAGVDSPPDTPSGLFTIGGTVSGLTSSGLVLQNNGGDDRTISASGPFTFATPLPAGAMYDVTVFAQPSCQSCSTTDPTGIVGNAPVTDVGVTCVTPPDPGISCGGSCCGVGDFCCISTQTCGGGCGGGLKMFCDSAGDCGADICCGPLNNGGNATDTTCQPLATCQASPNGFEILCDPAVVGECGAGSCVASTKYPGYHHCQ